MKSVRACFSHCIEGKFLESDLRAITFVRFKLGCELRNNFDRCMRRNGVMRILRVLMIVALALTVSACACRTKKVGDGNIPVAMEGGELKDVNFAFDSSDLDAVAQAVLKQNASWLNENSGRAVEIEGHCDERGTNEYNMALGARRANSVKDFMSSLGIDSSRMTTVSYGEELPIDPNHNEVAWAKNRRAHFNLK